MHWTIRSCGTLCFLGFFIVLVEAIVVSRLSQDLFTNPTQGCRGDNEYCIRRSANCFNSSCCTCECKEEYATFHSPGLTYYFQNGKPNYKFDGPESCAWNYYAHEGCRFVEMYPSNSSNRFLPLINLNKNGSVHLRISLGGVYLCDQYRLFSRRPLEHIWTEFEGNIFRIIWDKPDDPRLNLEWDGQGQQYGGLLLKLNFSCRSAISDSDPEPCMILKIKGSYDTLANTSEVPAEISAAQEKKQIEVEVQDPSSTDATQGTTGSPLISEATTEPFVSEKNTETSVITEKTIEPLVINQKRQPKTDMNFTTKRSQPTTVAAGGVANEPHGQTFWVLVYVFMAFAIFEVLCVAVFFVYRQRKRRRKRTNADVGECATNQTPATYDNHGMAVLAASTTNVTTSPEDIRLYENEVEPRYHAVARLGTLRSIGEVTTVENGAPRNMEASSGEPSRENSTVIKPGSIILLPKDCVIVHTSGSRKSKHSRHDNEESRGGANAEDNRSLDSWESFSSYYKTSTDEDYVSGSNPAPWENDSLYEEPDKGNLPKEQHKASLSSRSFGLERLFALQESVISSPSVSKQVEEEHIYESTESMQAKGCTPYYENIYDLPEDAKAQGALKSNRRSLRHVLHEEHPEVENAQPSLNLGCEFVNNDDDGTNNHIKLRPTRQSTVYLRESPEKLENGVSTC